MQESEWERQGKKNIKKGRAVETQTCACARARTARHGAGTHARCPLLSCCLYTGPDARRRPSSSTTTHRIVMRDRDTRRVFPPPRGKPSRPRRFGASSRENAASWRSLSLLPCVLLRALLALPSLLFLSCALFSRNSPRMFSLFSPRSLLHDAPVPPPVVPCFKQRSAW